MIYHWFCCFQAVLIPLYAFYRYILWSHLKCDQDRTERTAAEAITTDVVETEHACTRTIIVNASAVEERPVRVRKVRVIAVPRTVA